MTGGGGRLDCSGCRSVGGAEQCAAVGLFCVLCRAISNSFSSAFSPYKGLNDHERLWCAGCSLGCTKIYHRYWPVKLSNGYIVFQGLIGHKLAAGRRVPLCTSCNMLISQLSEEKLVH